MDLKIKDEYMSTVALTRYLSVSRNTIYRILKDNPQIRRKKLTPKSNHTWINTKDFLQYLSQFN